MSKENERFEGPTESRMLKDDTQFDVGDDQQGTKVYRSMSRLEQAYKTWKARAGSRDEQELTVQEAALTELARAFSEGGLFGTIGSIDLGNACFQGGVGRSHLAKTERQLNDRNKVYSVQQKLDHHQWIVVSNVVFNDHSLMIAGYAIGAMSERSAYRVAGDKLKEAGAITARFLGYRTK